jgi:hypothetical protein
MHMQAGALPQIARNPAQTTPSPTQPSNKPDIKLPSIKQPTLTAASLSALGISEDTNQQSHTTHYLATVTIISPESA